jgi:TRAP-type C4-dicarboxylate transport system permease small subunit
VKPLRALRRLEDAVLAGLLVVLLGAGVLQIVLRNLGLPALSWGESLQRNLLLWIALLGAAAASRSREHIRIDAVTHLLPERARAGVRCLTETFAAAVCGVLAWVTAGFVLDEMAFGATAFAGVPNWIVLLALPVGFGLMCLRHALWLARDARALAMGRSPEDPSKAGPRNR